LQQANAGETKSSMGDKFETSKAMLQIEIEKASFQKVNAEKLLASIENIPVDRRDKEIRKGSLVLTNRGWFYLAGSLGKVVQGENEIMVVSVQSPIGVQLLKRQVGHSFALNDRNYQIEEVL
jgi:hypothetical protein